MRRAAPARAAHAPWLLLRVWLACLACLLGTLAQAAPVSLAPDAEHVDLGPSIAVTEDRAGTATLADMLDDPERFIPVAQPPFSSGFSRSAWWLRMQVRNDSNMPLSRVLRVDPPRLEQVMVYLPADAVMSGAFIGRPDAAAAPDAAPGWWRLRGGMSVPVQLRANPDRMMSYPVLLPPGVTTFYVRVESRGIVTVMPSLSTLDALRSEVRGQGLAMVAVFGGLAVLGVAAMLIALMAREKIIACYGLMILFYLLYEMGVQGYGAIYIWTSTPQRSLAILNAMTLLELISAVALLQLSTQSRALAPWLDRGLDACRYACGILLIGLLVLPVERVVASAISLSAVVMTVMVCYLVVAVLRHSRPARLLLMSLLPVILVSSIRIGEFFGWYNLAGYADLLLPLGYLASMLFLATLVTNRLRIDQAERLSAQADSLMQAAQAKETLERAIAERTRELQEAKDRAESADMAKGHFLARMGHELRTPLHAILGYVQLLRRQRRADAALQSPLAIMEASGRHLLALINDVLDYSRGELAGLTLRPAPAYLFSLLRSAIDQVENSEHGHAGRIVLRAADDLPPVLMVDAQRLRQVLLNLLTNAVRHGQDGVIDLIVRREQTPAGKRLLFEVRDEGPGIAEADRLRIFEPFAHAGTAPSPTAGVGLGLAICRQLVRLMGGELTLESEVGKGSRFHFSIPLQEAKEADVPRYRDAVPGGRYAGPRRHILVVDDVVDNQRFLADLLGDCGFEVTLASNCDEARSALRLGGIDAALFDQFLPDGNGWTLLRDTRGLLPELPVLLISAAPAMPPADWTPEEGSFAACLLKPIDVDVLLASLSEQLGLDWLEEDEDDGAASAAPTDDEDADEALARVRHAVSDGDIFAIEEWVAQYRDHADPRLAGAAAALAPAVEAIDLTAMQAILAGEAGERRMAPAESCASEPPERR